MIRQRSILYNFFMSWTIEQMLIMLLFWWILNCVSQKKDFIQYPRFIKLIIADLMKKFPSIPLRLEEDYHSIKDDIPLVSVYTTGNVTVQGMLIPDAFLTKEIRATDGYKEYEMVFINVVVLMNQPNRLFLPKERIAKDSTTYVSKQQQEWDAWEEEIVIDEDEVIPEDETLKVITKFQNVDKRVPTIFDRVRIEATLNDMLSNQFRNVEGNPKEPLRFLYNKDQFFLRNGNTKEKKYILSLHKIYTRIFPEADLEEKMNRWVRKEFKNFNEDARLSIQHWKDSWHKRVYKQNQRKVKDNPKDYFSNHMITEVVRITTDQQYGLDYMERILVMRENDKPDSFSKANFKYLNKNDIEDLYYLCQNKKVNYRETKLINSLITFIRSCVIWERVHDFQLGIESYQIKVNLTAPTLTFSGIEAHEPYSIVDKPTTGLIYLNRKDEKRVTYLMEIVKLCDATMEKVLKEVKLKIFQSEPWKKPPLLGELDHDIMKAFKEKYPIV
ncbi:hypothetical protein Tco_1499575 [Tanacetum coccineum]